MATKYKKYFETMLSCERDLFENFRKLHSNYSKNQDVLQEQFNKEGKIVLAKIHEWESKLCSQSEKAGYATFTTKLSEKFMEEVRKEFPLIDFVGVIIKKKKNNLVEFNITKKTQTNLNTKGSFSIKKIQI